CGSWVVAGVATSVSLITGPQSATGRFFQSPEAKRGIHTIFYPLLGQQYVLARVFARAKEHRVKEVKDPENRRGDIDPSPASRDRDFRKRFQLPTYPITQSSFIRLRASPCILRGQ